MGFTKLGLSGQIVKGIQAAGYAIPTPIQSLAIQPAMDGRDVIGCAQTGTGKTAAFVLPMLHRLLEQPAHRNSRVPRALILTPTRELAQQVCDAITVYGRFTSLRAVPLYGGVSMEPQLKQLRRGVDIIVGTPGRLLDHIGRTTLDLSHVAIAVLDEADRMLDMGFIHDVRRIMETLPTSRQTLLFSATVSEEIEGLAKHFLREPQRVQAGERRNPAETVTQHFYATRKESKLDLLLHALEAERMESVLVFSRTKHGADKIARQLDRKGISSAALHSNRSQSQRQRALDGFRQGRYRVLVATDIAARGIDVDGISHVVNFDVPQYAEDYIHRIGRTGRAGAKGDAMTFIAPDDQQYLGRIQQFVGKRYPVRSYPGFVPAPRTMGQSPAERPVPAGGARRTRPARHQRRSGTVLGKRKKHPHPRMEAFSTDSGMA